MVDTQVHICHIYYYPPLPLNFANNNNKQASKHVTFPFWLEKLEPCRWRPRLGAPSQEVPSQNCAFCAPKQLFLAHNGPETHSKWTNDGETVIHSTCALTSS